MIAALRNPTPTQLDELIGATPLLWRGGQVPGHKLAALPTGFDALDAALPGGGWPQAGLVELLYAQHGLGEWQLFLPVLAKLSRDGYLACVRPPLLPYAPALAQAGVCLENLLWLAPETAADCWWAIEAALRAKACRAIVAWPGKIRPDHVRRLQVAAHEGNTLGFLMRPDGHSAPYVNLRLRLSRGHDGQAWVDVEKARGSHRTPRVALPC